MGELYTHKKQVTYLLVGFLFLIVLVLGIVKYPAIDAQLRDWKVLPESEGTTELYFENHLKLPTQYTPGKEQTVRFSTHNVERKRISYSYTINAFSEDANTRVELGRGTFTLEHDKTNTVTAVVSLPDLGPRSKVVITLTNTNQAISYWVKRAV